MEINELPTIRISVVAPPHSGKTTLITLLYEYMKNISGKDGGLAMSYKNNERQMLGYLFDMLKNDIVVSDGIFTISCPKNKRKLDSYLKDVLDNRELPKSCLDGDVFEFVFSIKTSNRTINQRIEILDADGDMINNWNGGCGVYEKGKPALQKFRKHLRESQILLLPIDMPIVIEDDSEKFIKSVSALNYANIKAIVTEWRNYRKESSENSFVHLIMTKCETYYWSENKRITEYEQKVQKCFKGILDELKKVQCVSVHYTPVFTAGFKLFNKGLSNWKQIDNTTYQYQEGFDPLSSRIKPSGINDIWNSIFDHMAYNMSNHLKTELGKQSFVSFGTDEIKEIAIKAIDFFMKIMELKTENINDNFNYNKILKPRWKKNT
ncbi:MAG: hypothetical protein IKP73_14310 [Bacteroidales bacterium]|nr:hypothetical protein [Bacteroidales bacterium]